MERYTRETTKSIISFGTETKRFLSYQKVVES